MYSASLPLFSFAPEQQMVVSKQGESDRGKRKSKRIGIAGEWKRACLCERGYRIRETEKDRDRARESEEEGEEMELTKPLSTYNSL